MSAVGAKADMRVRCDWTTGSSTVTMVWALACIAECKLASISSALRIGSDCNVIPNLGAASCICFNCVLGPAAFAFQSAARRTILGEISLISCSRFELCGNIVLPSFTMAVCLHFGPAHRSFGVMIGGMSVVSVMQSFVVLDVTVIQKTPSIFLSLVVPLAL